MKMPKSLKLLAVTLAAVMFAAFATSAAAISPAEKAQRIMETANTKIEVCVDAAQFAGNILEAAGFSKDSRPVEKLCDSVENSTESITAQAEKSLDKLGVTYVCTSYAVDIGGNSVVIDPFIVVA
ncbi:MAG: hypothetical protein P4L75_04305 [Clostridia bacterium]|nr:hypothetical protein [Clostridia bacterium]